uniref:Ig-like domain-containing protein n=1 Tax=Angiostrongylus cantonensis TaxID=6313 RepID=A0A158P7J0_ANGCA
MVHYRRHKRDQQEKNYVALAPSYELILSHDQPSQIDTTLAVTVEEGQALHLMCTAGEGIDEQTLKFEKGFEEVKGQQSRRSFEDATHSGIYECFARTSAGEEHSRKMRVSTKAVLPKGFTPCDNVDAFCGSNGRCGMKNHDKLFTTVKVVAGAGGTLNIMFIFLTVIFACLFFKERKRLRQLQSHLVLPTEEPIFVTKPRNPYDDSNVQLEKASLATPSIPDRPLSRSTRLSTLRKFRNAIKERLPSTNTISES